MLHHFGDNLDREGAYWTMTSNRDRYAYRIADVPAGSPEITIVTIGKDDANWRRVFTLSTLEELTLHEPTKAQLAAIGSLRQIKRLRITHARPRTLDVLRSFEALEELVLEYVSGISDLSPLRDLPRLRALHLENLRRVASFDGLAGIDSLEYLAIYGTLDWKQPIQDFEFLRGLPNLQVLALWEIINKSPYPALLPALSLTRLKRIRLHPSYLDAAEIALLEEGLHGVEGADWGPFRKEAREQIELPRDDIRAHIPEDVLRANHREVTIWNDGRRMIGDPRSEWFEFTGKGAGRVKCSSPHAAERCREYAASYEAMKAHARAVQLK